MHGLTTINKLNAEAAEAAYIMNKHEYIQTLPEYYRFAFTQLDPELQRLHVEDYVRNFKNQNRKLTIDTLEKR